MKKIQCISFKKAIAFTLSAVILMSFSACGKAVTTSETSPKEDSDEPVTITIGMNQDGTVQDYTTNAFTKLVEKESGINIEFLLLPSKGSDATTKIALMVSSGAKLPDVFNEYFGTTTIFDYASKGVFVKLNDYFDNPELTKYFGQIPEPDKSLLLNSMKQSDGSIYSMPKYNPQIWNEVPVRMWYNVDFLDKVGSSVPTTIDEFEATLRAVAEGDPNGNGKKDEVGLAGSNSGWHQKPYDFIMNAFTYTDSSKAYFAVKDGTIYPSFATDEWREGLTYMNKLCTEGLYSPLSFTQDQTQLKSLVNVEGGMVGFVPAASYTTFQTSPDENGKLIPLNNYQLMAPLKGTNGQQTTPYFPTMPVPMWFITKDCKNPEAAFKLGDTFYKNDVSRSIRWGEKDVDWSDDPEVVSKYQGDYEFMGIMPDIAQVKPIWGTPQNSQWAEVGPMYTSIIDYQKVSLNLKSDFPLAVPEQRREHQEKYIPYMPEKDYIRKLYFTLEELEKMSAEKTAIDTFVGTSISGFITGSKPLSEWDSYIDQLYKLGLQNYIDANQKAYDMGESILNGSN